MEDKLKYITKFLDSYIHDVSYYAIRNKNGCIPVIYIFNHNGRCLGSIGVEHHDRYTNVFTLNQGLFIDMLRVIGSDDYGNTKEMSMYSGYMRNKFLDILKKYVEDNSCNESDPFMLSSNYPYMSTVSRFGNLTIEYVYALSKNNHNELFQGEVEKLG